MSYVYIPHPPNVNLYTTTQELNHDENYYASTLQAFKVFKLPEPRPNPRVLVSSLDHLRRGYVPFTHNKEMGIEVQSGGINPLEVNDLVIPVYRIEANRNSLGDLSNLALAPTELELEITGTQPSVHFGDLSDTDDDVSSAHTQQQHPSPFLSQSLIPLGATALALARNEPAPKRAKRAPPPQKPKPKQKARSSNKKLATSTLEPKGKVAARRTRSSGPITSPAPEPEDEDEDGGSEYEDVPVGPSRKRGRRAPPQAEQDGEEKQTGSGSTATTVLGDPQNRVEADSASASTINVAINADSGPSTAAMTTIVEVVGRTVQKVEITLKNGRWRCPYDGCSHTSDKSHDMGRHLAKLDHRKKDLECKRCKTTFTRPDALKRHVKSRCTMRR